MAREDDNNQAALETEQARLEALHGGQIPVLMANLEEEGADEEEEEDEDEEEKVRVWCVCGVQVQGGDGRAGGR